MTVLFGVLLLTLLVITAVAIVRTKNLFVAVMLLGIFSLLIAANFFLLDAADVALTEAAVGAGISTVLFLGALALTSEFEHAPTPHRWFSLAVVTGATLVVLYATFDKPAFGDPEAPIHQHVAPWSLQKTPEYIDIPNVVTAVLGSYRGYDTLGEVFVVFTAGIGVLFLLSARRGPVGRRPSTLAPDPSIGLRSHVIPLVVSQLLSPFILLFAMVMLGEQLNVWKLGGMALIVTGVIITSQARIPDGMTRGSLVVGILYGVASTATLAVGIVFAKPVLERSDVIRATAVRQIGALAVVLPVALVLPRRRARLSVFRPDRSWRHMVPGTVLGSYLALILWIGGMKFTEAGTAAILNQTSTVYILVFASLFLGEAFTIRKVVAAGLAIAGVLLVLQPLS